MSRSRVADTQVSVIIPAYNAVPFITEAVASALEQQGANLEIVVVDDGSTDGTGEVVKQLAAHDCRIKYIYQTNQNQGAARNAAVQHSSGSLVAFLDADDVWESQKLRMQTEALRLNDVSVVFSDASHFAGSDDITIPVDLFGLYKGRLKSERFLCMLLQRNAIPLSSVLVTRTAFESVGGFDETPALKGCEDWDLWLRLASHGHHFFGMDRKLVRYRTHPSQTSTQRVHMIAASIAVREQYLEHPSVGADKERLRRLLQRERVRLALLQQGYREAIQQTIRLLNLRYFGLRAFGSFAKQVWTVVLWSLDRPTRRNRITASVRRRR